MLYQIKIIHPTQEPGLCFNHSLSAISNVCLCYILQRYITLRNTAIMIIPVIGDPSIERTECCQVLIESFVTIRSNSKKIGAGIAES